MTNTAETINPSNRSKFNCRICGSSDGVIDVFPEKIFGTFEKFEYFECNECGCVQIIDIPEDMSQYYPEEYGSHTPVSAKKIKPYKRMICKILLTASSRPFFKSFLQRVLKQSSIFRWLLTAGVSNESKVLDVGCGMGGLLCKMWNCGVHTLVGIDPFIPSPINYKKNFHIIKGDINQISEQFDLIICNHSLEHMPNQNILGVLRDLLTEQGCLIIRIPLSQKYLWKTFRENWAQLDPPRHLFLHSEKSFHKLADSNGFEVFQTFNECHAGSVASSEKLKKNLSYSLSNKKVFTDEERKNFVQFAKKLRLNNEGDQATFFLKKKLH